MSDPAEVIARTLTPRAWEAATDHPSRTEATRRRSLHNADNALAALHEDGYVVVRRDVVAAALPEVGPNCPCGRCAAAREAWAELTVVR